MAPLPPLVVVVVGTDHHPFDRLVRWVDEWAGRRPARVVIQHGRGGPPRHAAGHRLLAVEELDALLLEASAVVCHGGPGTIAAARDAGTIPIVVPRRASLGEAVDDHQVSFAAVLADAGEVVCAADPAELGQLLDAVVDRPDAFAVPEGTVRERSIGAAARFGGLVRRLLSSPPPEATVLYVAGWGRSGSTLFERMLGQVDGVFAAGELREIWQRGVIEDRTCGCGEPFSSCATWQKIGSVAFGGWDRIDADAMQALRLRLDRGWSPPRVLSARLSPARDADVARYVEHLDALYRAIAEVTSARIIVDSSKLASSVALLRRIDRLDVRAIHLVRDPRGVATSWAKVVRRPDGDDTLPRYGTVAASARYLAYNGMAHGLRSIGVPYERLRYEDLIADPVGAVARSLAFAGVDPSEADLGYIAEGEVRLAPDHTVDGNPMRVAVGRMPLREDDAWRFHLSGPRRVAVAVLTSPLLVAYGYGRRRRP